MPPSTFDAKTTAVEAAETFSSQIKGKVVLVTGASQNGLGGECARVVALHSPKLIIIAGRSKDKLDETEAAIKVETPTVNIRQLVVDLGSLISVRAAAKEVLAYEETIDVLINNAAKMASPYEIIAETGFESQFATNHLGPFLFTNLILSKLTSKADSRVINVSSMAHRRSEMRWDDVGFKGGETYERWVAYGQGKTANMLFSKSLSEAGFISFSLHPGIIWTNLVRHLSEEDQIAMGFLNEDGSRKADGAYTWKSIPEGTATHIVAAFDPDIKAESGSYLFDAQLANDQALPYALDSDNASKLWKLSEEMVGQKFVV